MTLAKKIAVLVLLGLAPTAGLLHAEPIFALGSGGLTGILATDAASTVVAFDVRGTVEVFVGNPGLIGSVIITDGAPPDPPAPNTFLLTQTVPAGELALLSFDTAGITIGGPGALVPAVGVAAFGPVSDPALSAMLGPLTFGFATTGSTVVGDSTLTSLALVGIAAPAAVVPEPATSVLLGTGLFAVGFILRRYRR